MLSRGVRTFVPSVNPNYYKNFRILYQNVRGLRSKTVIFSNNVTSCGYDIIALTETFLTSSVCDGELFPHGWQVARHDRIGEAGWGGVLLAVRDCYNLRVVTNIDELTPDKEILFAVVSWKNVKFLCCVVYLPPSYNDEQYLNVLTCIENAICKFSDMDVLIFGDFNLNSCSVNVKTQFTFFTDFCKLTQYNHVLNDNGGLLDLVLTGLTSERITVYGGACGEALVAADAYHPPLSVRVSLPNGAPRPPPPLPPTKRLATAPDWNFRKADFSALYAAVAELDWTDLLDSNIVDSAIDIFYRKLYECINTHVPLKKTRCVSRYVYPCWYTSEIILNIRYKYFHFVKYKSEGKEFNKELYKYYRTHVKALIDYAFQQHIQMTQKQIVDEPAKFWGYVKDKRKDRRVCDRFTCNGAEVEGADAADAFARYFSSVFQPVAPQLDAAAAARHGSSFDSARVAVDTVDEADLLAAVKRLKPCSSSGPDGIPSFFVKDCRRALEVPLLFLYNLCLSASTYPQRWKTSRVTPVPKAGSSVDVSSHRPIAVLSILGKVFESILDRRIGQQVGPVLNDCQHGFRRARSTTTNHINLVDYVANEMDAGRQVDATYFDFKKAFDLVDNDILLLKLSEFGFTPKLLKFFSSYLSNRRQYVRVAGHESDDYYTRSGVSQGSTLGPTLFLLMINDLPKAVTTAKCLMFADDLKLYLAVSSDADAMALQQDINSVAQWSDTNRLPFNTCKCQVITFSRSRSPLYATYHLLDVPLVRVDEIRDLGLTLDSKLDFRTHMTYTCKKASKMLGFIMRVASQFSDIQVAKVLYNSYVRSILEFGAIVWDPYESKYSIMIERIQRKFARWLYKRSYGYYPYLYPSLFVSGMVSLDTLALRRKLLLVVHYYAILHNTVDNQTVLRQMGLRVPRRGAAAAPRCAPRLFALPFARTCRARNAPTARARAILGNMLVQDAGIDIFFDSFAYFVSRAYIYFDCF